MPKSLGFYIKTRLFLSDSLPSPQILAVKKKRNTGEKMRGRKWRRAKYLRGEGPIKRGLFSTEECAQRWREMKGGKKLLFILSKDRFFFFSFTARGRLTGRQVGVWIEGGGQVVSNTKAHESSLLAEQTHTHTVHTLQTHNPAIRFTYLNHCFMPVYLLGRYAPY